MVNKSWFSSPREFTRQKLERTKTDKNTAQQIVVTLAAGLHPKQWLNGKPNQAVVNKLCASARLGNTSETTVERKAHHAMVNKSFHSTHLGNTPEATVARNNAKNGLTNRGSARVGIHSKQCLKEKDSTQRVNKSWLRSPHEYTRNIG